VRWETSGKAARPIGDRGKLEKWQGHENTTTPEHEFLETPSIEATFEAWGVVYFY
jgi:hypothetical protein